jgi:predicted Ser/Thr protein kinase
MPAPSRETLLCQPPLRFREGRNISKADIFLWETPGVRLVIKDYHSRPFWIRETVGRVLIGRECRAYRLLQGISGIPRLAGRIDAYALAIEFVDGRDLSTFKRGEVPAAFFDRLREILRAIHAAGVAQGDLHHRDVLVGPGSEPFLVDFSTAVFRTGTGAGVRRRLFEAACQSDQRAALKLKRRHAPHSLSEAETGELDRVPRWYRLGKRLRPWLPGRRRA